MSDRIFVSIAVSKPQELVELPGARNAARRMACWASANGYRTVTIDDSNDAVTIDRIRDEVTPLLTPATSRLIVFFAGHGSAKDANKSYWLLSNWCSDWSEAIDVSAFQRMLRFFGPKQLTVIGDCCRVVHKSFLDVLGSAVLERPQAEPSDFELDRFFAADAGEESFMIRAQGSNDAFCIFSEVLLDALEGDAPDAFELEVNGDRAVTSGSLTIHLKNAVPREAKRYQVEMKPQPEPGYYTDRIYARFPPLADIGPAPPPPNAILRRWKPFAAGAGEQARSVPKVKLIPASQTRGASDQGRAQKEYSKREAAAAAFRADFSPEDLPTHFETDCGLAVLGAESVSVESSSGSLEPDRNRPDTWFPIYVGDEVGRDWANVVIDLGPDRAAYACVICGFITSLQVHNADRASIVLRPTGAHPTENGVAVELLARANAGLLTSDDILNTAAELRESKHRDFVLGCVAAYLYDSIGDVESIRSIAAYYASVGQVVPLDIALLSNSRLSADGAKLFVDIPATARRAPRTGAEEARRFIFEATQSFDHVPVGGSAPWMRGGWTAIATALFDDSAFAWREKAREIIPHLARSPFTMVRDEGREALADLAGVPIQQTLEVW